jgi:hypothetical protein
LIEDGEAIFFVEVVFGWGRILSVIRKNLEV